MKAAYSTALVIFLPLQTIWFHKCCKSRFQLPTCFTKQWRRTTLSVRWEPNLNLKSYLANATPFSILSRKRTKRRR
uniref:Secreted protein n=1 Tax=Arundo donax TaxID=35708 RepID=A0A0A9ATZ1_ARUDO